MRVKVGQRSCMVKRTTVMSNQHRLTTRMKVGPGYCMVKKTTVVSWRDLSPYEDESKLMKLYGQENYGCVRRTPSHQKGESWPKGFVCSRRLQVYQDGTLTKGKKIVPKDLYCQKDYSCVKGPPF